MPGADFSAPWPEPVLPIQCQEGSEDGDITLGVEPIDWLLHPSAWRVILYRERWTLYLVFIQTRRLYPESNTCSGYPVFCARYLVSDTLCMGYLKISARLIRLPFCKLLFIKNSRLCTTIV